MDKGQRSALKNKIWQLALESMNLAQLRETSKRRGQIFGVFEQTWFRTDISVKSRALLIRTSFTVFVPEHNRNAVTLFINAINQNLRCGSFVLDPSDGELTFRNSTLIHDQMTPDDIKYLHYFNIISASKLSPFVPSMIARNEFDAQKELINYRSKRFASVEGQSEEIRSQIAEIIDLLTKASQ